MKKQINKPFFSIVIPTYNRAQDLHAALIAIVSQSYKNFEVIVSDNCSTDETEHVVNLIADSRIIYRRNKRNIGWIGNLQKAINRAAGKYIILQGDDDRFIDKLCLYRINKQIIKYKYPGYIRINYLSKIQNENIIFDFDLSKKIHQTYKFRAGQKPENIISYIEASDPYFVTGICFKNEYVDNKTIIDSEFIPWFSIIYEMTKKYGGLYISNYYFVATWLKKMRNPGHPFFYLKDGKFTFESYFEEVRKIVSPAWYNTFIRKHVIDIIYNFPANKLASNNKNLIACSKRVIELAPLEKRSIRYWFYLIASFITPQPVLLIARNLFLQTYINKFKKNINFI